MTYTFKLSRRLAVTHISSMLAPLLLLAACSTSDLTEASHTNPDGPAPMVSGFVVTPKRVMLEPNQRLRLRAHGLADGKRSLKTVEWWASGGTISPEGIFSADTEGTYKIVGKGRGKGRNSKPPSDTTIVVVSPTPPTLQRVTVSPDPASLLANQDQLFTAAGVLEDGSEVEVAVSWSATGGSIDAGGVYTAGGNTGKFRVVAKSVSTSHADTSDVAVGVSAPTLTAVVLSPASASLQTGGTQRFTASAVYSDSSKTAISVVFQATGGTITEEGLYTAGGTSGTFRVIGSLEGKSDTSIVTVTSSQTACTSTATLLCPGDDLQAKANAAGPGATLTLRPGVYRLQSVTPLQGQTWLGEPGAIVSGARLLTEWVQDGSRWYVTGQTQQNSLGGGSCRPNVPCLYPDDVYRNDTLLKRVTSLGAVTSGTYFFDYGADRIYVGDNPAGQRLEGAAVTYAFKGGATNVTIRGLVIEKYANAAQTGAVGGTGPGSGWTIREAEIRYNHGMGVRGSNGMVVVQSHIHHNGQMGLGAQFARVENNEISYNNTAGYDPYWEAGGTKFVATTNLVVRGNYSHHNAGFGLWTDINNIGTLYEGNRVEDNDLSGIFHEISYQAVIRDNIGRRNGRRLPPSWWMDGACILIGTSRDVEVYNNTCEDNVNGITASHTNRGSGSHGVYEVRNLWVHDNVIRQPVGGFTGIGQNVGSTAVYTSMGNRFDRNTYTVASANTKPFAWMDATRSWTEWRGYGHEAGGSSRTY